MDTESITAYVGLGSNLGDRAGNLLLAVRGLMEAGLNVCRLSGVYETDPVGVEDHSRYLNMVAEVEVTNISPSQMLARMVRIEYLLGRRHKFTQAPRTADLDLLLYGDLVIKTPFVQIPHKDMHLRRFVLVPLAELSPHIEHPVTKQSIEELLENIEDPSSVTRWNPNEELEIVEDITPQSFSRSTNT